MDQLCKTTLSTPGELILATNCGADKGALFGATERAGFDPEAALDARRALTGWRDYKATPLFALTALAGELGVGQIFAKYEGARTELQSFKALGGAYALSVVLSRRLVDEGYAETVTTEDLESGRYRHVTGTLTAVCASDGNHGRSVAWGAHRFGCKCIVYLPKSVTRYRAEAIARYGAKVVRVEGNYDDAVHQAVGDASRAGWLVISDMASIDFQDISRLVMAGYSLAVDEALQEIGGPDIPTHVFVQAGCGAFAAVVAGYLWSVFGEARPCTVSVEPLNAACLLASVAAGELAVVRGEHATVMGGLACGEVSFLAWKVLHRGLDFACAMADRYAIEAVRSLASGRTGVKVAAAESGAAGVGALMAISRHDEFKQRVGLTRDSRVLLFITEGITDPTQYDLLLRNHER